MPSQLNSPTLGAILLQNIQHAQMSMLGVVIALAPIPVPSPAFVTLEPPPPSLSPTPPPPPSSPTQD